MIVGIGCDIVEVKRIKKVLERRGKDFIATVLSPAERRVYRARRSANELRGTVYLASRWAAKEAFSKAFGSGIRGAVTFKNITVKNNKLGAPFFAFGGELSGIIEQKGITTHLTISDSETVCMAVVVCEKE